MLRLTSLYSGTGALAVNVASTGNLSASQRVIVTECPWSRWDAWALFPFQILDVGDDCSIVGTGTMEFRPDPGSLCTLRFSDGPHTLRVTDVAMRYGRVQSHTGIYLKNFYLRPYVRDGSLSVQIGGDDRTTGVHAVYSFSGSNLVSSPIAPACDDQRPAHVAKAPEAIDRDESDMPLGGRASPSELPLPFRVCDLSKNDCPSGSTCVPLACVTPPCNAGACRDPNGRGVR